MEAKEGIDEIHTMNGIHCIIPRTCNHKIQQDATNRMHTQNFTELSHKEQVQEDNSTGEHNANRTFSYCS